MLAGKMKLRNFLLLVVLAGGGVITASYLACNKSSEPAKDKERIAMPPPPPAIDAAAPAAVDAAVAAPHADLLPRAYDAEALAWRTKSVAAGKGKDVSKGRPFKINVYQDAGSKTVDRVKVDANRNNKFDDKISFKGDQITLEHAPADDENYTEKYLWNGAGWTKH